MESSKNQRLNTDKSQVQKVAVDTVAGLGNAVTAVMKGVTEAVGAVGGAINETTINHSKKAYGEDYTTHVTQQYVLAANEIGDPTHTLLLYIEW